MAAVIEISQAQFRVLWYANKRPRGNLCPIFGIHAAAQTSLIQSLDRKGLIEWSAEPFISIPFISDEGRAALVRRLSVAAEAARTDEGEAYWSALAAGART
jgi:hypothetical protein